MRGAYGLRVLGIPGASPWMELQPEAAPCLHVGVDIADPDDGPSAYDTDAADLRLLGGARLVAHRGSGEVHYRFPSVPPDADLLHPYLAAAAALVWRWEGREAIHAGAVAVGGGAVLLLGGREAGKSTTLGWLSSAGIPVLTDDLAVLDGNQVLAGPRSVDLRRANTATVGTHQVRGGGRHRVRLPPAPRSLPLRGISVLEWGESLVVSPVPIEQRAGLLAPQRHFPDLATDPRAFLELLSVPPFRITRPRGLASVAATGEAIMETFGRPSPATRPGGA